MGCSSCAKRREEQLAKLQRQREQQEQAEKAAREQASADNVRRTG